MSTICDEISGQDHNLFPLPPSPSVDEWIAKKKMSCDLNIDIGEVEVEFLVWPFIIVTDCISTLLSRSALVSRSALGTHSEYHTLTAIDTKRSMLWLTRYQIDFFVVSQVHTFFVYIDVKKMRWHSRILVVLQWSIPCWFSNKKLKIIFIIRYIKQEIKTKNTFIQNLKFHVLTI